MDSTSCVLSVLVVILLLILLCSEKGSEMFSNKAKKRKLKTRPMNESPVVSTDTNDIEEPEQYYSNTGTGLMNRKMNAQYDDLQNLDGYGGWPQVAQYMALEPEIYKSDYSEDTNRSTSGPSSMTIRDDRNSVNPFLLRDADYHSVYADSTARTTQTEMPDQMAAQTRYLI